MLLKTWGCIVFFSLLVANANSQTQSTFNFMDDEIFRQPWASYQNLLQLESKFEIMSNEKKLLWLVQKAQSEYLLKFVDDFTQTTAKASALVTLSTAVEIRARIDYFSGVVLQNASQHQIAITIFRRALRLAINNDLDDIYIIAKQNIAYTQSIIEDFDTSLTDIKIAHDKAIELDDDFLLARVNEAYGAIYFFMQYYEKSIDSYSKALKVYQTLGYPAHSAEAIYGLAKSYRYSGKFTLANQYFRLYGENIGYTPSKNILFFAHYGLSMSLADQGNCLQALLEIEKALKLKGLQDFNAELYKQKASCLIEQNQLKLAEIALKKAEEIYVGIPELFGTARQLEVTKISSDLANANGDNDQRDVLLKNYYQSYANLLVDNPSSWVINFRSSKKIELQHIKDALAFQQRKVVDFDKKHNPQIQIYFAILILFLLLIMAYVLIYQYKMNNKIKNSSNLDLLSGLLNRHNIFQSLAQQINALTSTQTNLSIMLLSVDNIRQINTQYGHKMGDTVIKMCAAIGQASLSNNTDIGGITDRQFLCLLPDTNSKQAENNAKVLIRNIKQQPIKSPLGGCVDVNISVGIAEFGIASDSAKTIFTHAEQALAKAQNSGESCVKIYDKTDGVCL